MQTLLGEILAPGATLRGQVRDRLTSLARAREQALGAEARQRFNALPADTQTALVNLIAAVPDSAWARLRGEVREALDSRVVDGKDTLNELMQERIGLLNLGNFGNTGEDRSEYFGLWTGELKLDTGKMGLWPGGFLLARVQGQYGDSVNARSGVLLPVNMDSVNPNRVWMM